jgi:transposase
MDKISEKRSYDRAFKERAVKLSHQRTDLKEFADGLGISRDRLYKWRSEFARHGEASLTSSTSFAPRQSLNKFDFALSLSSVPRPRLGAFERRRTASEGASEEAS